MDGLQVQWLLDPAQVELPYSTAFAIDAILAAAVQGKRQARLLEY